MVDNRIESNLYKTNAYSLNLAVRYYYAENNPKYVMFDT